MTTQLPPEVVKPHVSPSALEMFFKCPEQYRRRYLEKEIIPPGFALVKGGSVDAAATENFTEKIKTREDMKADDFKALSASAFDHKIKTEGILLTKDEESTGKAKVLGAAKDSTVRMAGQWIATVGPKYQPVGVQEKIRIALPGPLDLLGILDLILPEDVQDTKTGSKKKNQGDIDKDTQFTTYWALFKARFGRDPKSVIVDTVIDRVSKKTAKTTTEHQALTTTRTPGDLSVLAARINAFAAGIKAGVFSPAPVGAWWCSAKSCGYARTCPYFNYERAAAEEAQDDE